MHRQYTGQAKKALDLAGKLSRKLKHNYIGTEHILAGLIQEKNGVAAQVLVENQVEEGKLLELIADLIADRKSVV